MYIHACTNALSQTHTCTHKFFIDGSFFFLGTTNIQFFVSCDTKAIESKNRNVTDFNRCSLIMSVCCRHNLPDRIGKGEEVSGISPPHKGGQF